MGWVVTFLDDFEVEFDLFPAAVQDAILAKAGLLELEGPRLGRPHADTLTGSKHANMKELRCEAHGGAWRVLFAFDPARQAILLIAGDKSGVKEKRFYKRIIAKADERFDRHLAKRKGEDDGDDIEGEDVTARLRPSRTDRGRD